MRETTTCVDFDVVVPYTPHWQPRDAWLVVLAATTTATTATPTAIQMAAVLPDDFGAAVTGEPVRAAR